MDDDDATGFAPNWITVTYVVFLACSADESVNAALNDSKCPIKMFKEHIGSVVPG